MEVEKDSEPAIHHLVEFLKRKKQKELSRKWRILKCCQSFQWQGYRALGLGANLYICMEYWKSWRPKTGEEKASVSQRPPPYGYVKRPLKGQSTQEVGLAGGTFLSDSSDQLLWLNPIYVRIKKEKFDCSFSKFSWAVGQIFTWIDFSSN